MFVYLIVGESKPSPFFPELGLIILQEANVELSSLRILIDVALHGLDGADALGTFLSHRVELCWGRHA